MKALLAYALAAALALGLLAGGALLLLERIPGIEAGLWIAAGIAWMVQLFAFGAIVASRRPGGNFMWGWGSGIALRLLAVLAVALWVSREGAPPAAATLLGLVAFLMVLVLLEPIFLRLAD